MTWRQWIALVSMAILVPVGVVFLALGGRQQLVLTVMVIVVGWLSVGVIVHLANRQRRPRHGPTDACLRCGYDLTRINLPRCPECGALVGFKRSADELGLDQSEVKFKSRPMKDSEQA